MSTFWLVGLAAEPNNLLYGARLGVLGNSKDVSILADEMNHPTYTVIEYVEGRISTGPFGNQSHGGYTTEDYLTVIEPLLATAPEIVLVGDATNDIHDLPLQTIQDNYDEIIDQLQTGGVDTIILETTPLSANLQQQYVASLNTLNTWIRAKASSTILIADTAASSYTCFNPLLCRDGTHPTTLGALNYLGPTEGVVVQSLLSSTPVFPTSGAIEGNLNTNWDMSGTGGTLSDATGVVADGWDLTNTCGVTVVASKGTLANGNTAQVLTITGTCTTATGLVQLNHVETLAITSGQFYEGWAEYEIASASGGDPELLYGFAFNDATSNIYDRYNPESSDNGPVPARSAIARTTPVSVVNAASSTNMRCQFGFAVGSGVDVVIKIGRRFLVQQELVAYAIPYDQSQTAIGYTEPAITGSATVGNTLTVKVGSFSGGNLVYTYQWLRDATPIGGATNTTYVVQIADSTHTISCVITATNSFGADTATAGPTAVVP